MLTKKPLVLSLSKDGYKFALTRVEVVTYSGSLLDRLRAAGFLRQSLY